MIDSFFCNFVSPMITETPIERHPWPPFMPNDPRMLMLGTFPPKPNRWSMDFFYPNRINDMWRLMGLIFYGDRDFLWDTETNAFRLDDIKAMLNEKGIALWDTAMAVRRLRDNASDKFLEIVEPINLVDLLDAHPTIGAVVTAGEKATGVIAEIAKTTPPRMGECIPCTVGTHRVTLWRMPSSSRAYPMSIEKKASFYRMMFIKTGIL